MRTSNACLRTQRHLLWRVTTIILMLAALSLPQLSSNASPAKADGWNLLGSDITASPGSIAYGEETTLTVTLRNSGSAAAVAQVTVQFPSELEYVSGSASAGGAPEGNGVSWKDVSVPGSSSVALTLKATPAATVSSNKEVLVVAALMSEHLHFIRLAKVTIVSGSSPPPSPGAPNLKGSHKWASRHTAGPDDRFTYTILLHNSGTQPASVDVEDDLPSHVSYVSGSANQGGAYNDGAGTISWNDVSVPAGGEKRLTFDVQAGSVDYPRLVVNKATIRTGDDPFERIAPVLLLPESLDPDFDHVHPWVGDLTIGDRDVLGSRSVTLHISAGDDKGVTEMYVREWQLVTSFPPHWEVVRSSGWVPFQENYPWTLGSESGTHYVGVWVSDHAKNVSWFGGYAMDFASLLLPGESLASKESVPYLVHYEAGVNVTATLAPSSGDADLYVWYPGHHAGVDQRSTKSGTNVDQVSFTTPRDGIYLFLVHAYTATTYDLSITPAGGPRAYLADAAGVEDAGQPAPAGEVDAQAKVELTAEPVLIYSGLDPMDVAPPQVAQVARETIYLPLIVR